MKNFAKPFLQICLGISLVIGSISLFQFSTKTANASSANLSELNGRYYPINSAPLRNDRNPYITLFDTHTGQPTNTYQLDPMMGNSYRATFTKYTPE